MLDRPEEDAPMTAIDKVPPAESKCTASIDPADEVGSLARELVRGYAELVESYRRSWGITQAEADAKAGEGDGAWTERYLTEPPDQLSWWSLAKLLEHDPEKGAAAWARVKAEARKELRSGHRAARALEWGGDPWSRARHLAVRDAFVEDWRPRGGIEAALVDLLAQSFNAYLLWTERLTSQAETEGQLADHKLKQDGYWQPPRLATGEWMEWCADQAERAHRRFLITLRALQDLRRLPTVSIAAAQVNVGGYAQQVNVGSAGGEGGRP